MLHHSKLNLACFLLIAAISLATRTAADDCCQPGDVKLDLTDCTKYFVCCTGQFKPMTCPSGEYFNAEAGGCVVDNGECNCNGQTCTEGDIIADASNCANFKICVNGKYQSEPCPSGEYWNSAAKECQLDQGQCNGTPTPPVCVDGEVKEHPSNCAGYFNCTNGQWVAQLCSAGKYWNVTAKACVKDEGQCNGTPAPECVDGDLTENPANCAGYFICNNGKYVPQLCEAGKYWNNTVKQCLKDEGQCNGTTPPPCVDGDLKCNPQNCFAYYNCTNGKYVNSYCAEGLYWNANDSQCQKNEGQCNDVPGPGCKEGSMMPNPSNCAGFYICINSQLVPQLCASGLYFSVPENQCVKDEGQCNVTPAPECAEGEIKQDPSNCAGFLNCTNGQLVPQLCASGLYFSVPENKCVKDEGQCNVTPAPECVEGEIQQDPSNCAGFLNCTNGQLVPQLCPTGDYWSPDAKDCVKDEGQCNVTPAPECVEGEIQQDPSNCAGFLNCTNGQLVPQLCPSGNYFNVTVKKCVKDDGQCNVTPAPVCDEGKLSVDESNCAGYLQCVNNAWVPRKCAAQSYFDKQVLACVPDTNGVCVPKVCDPECCDKPNDWLGSVDNNCSAFIHCVYGNMYQQRCPNNLQFNNITKECDFPENVQCDDGSAPPSGPTAGPSGTYCESKGRCVGKSDGTMMAAQNVCSGSYIVCHCECEVNFTCQPGLAFNIRVGVCDYAQNVGC